MGVAVLEHEVADNGEPHSISPEELLAMPDGFRFELIDGELVERNMGAESSKVAARGVRFVGNHVEPENFGSVFGSDCGYQIFPDRPKKVRFADGSFIARGRLPDDKAPRGHMTIAPDWALEVVSPNDTAEEVETKRLEWLEAGVRLVWIAYPENRTVHVFRREGSPQILTDKDVLQGEDVIPGFSCPVAELFKGI